MAALEALRVKAVQNFAVDSGEADRLKIAFVLSLTGGVLILIGGLARFLWWRWMGMGMMMHMGPMMMGGGLGDPLTWGLLGLLCGLIVIFSSFLLYLRPDQNVFLGALIIVFSSISVIGAFGGFVVGFILGFLGGILALSWKPAHAPPSYPSAPSPPVTLEPATPREPVATLSKALTLMRPVLSEDEQRVLEEVVKAGGEILQSELPKKSGFSKATVSKVLSALERRNVVAREKYKWTYRVRLSERLISEAKNA
jgi:hypothetical protein